MFPESSSASWKEQKVGTCCDILDHLRTPVSFEERGSRKGQVPYYGANGQQGTIDGYIFDEDLILIAEDGGDFDNYATKPIAYRISGKSWVNNHAHVLRAKADFDQSFIFHSLAHKDIRFFIRGGTRSKLNKGELLQVSIAIPQARGEQRSIAAILDIVGDVIQRTEALIEKLRRVKAGMLHDLLTRGLDENGELRDPLTHPEQFKDSPLGRIPRAWHIRKLNELAVFQNGKAFPSAEYRKEGIRLLRPGNLPLSEFVSWEPGNATCLSESWGSKASDYLVGGNELVMNLTAQSLEDQFLGRVCMTRPDEICLLNQRIARFRSVDCNLPFLFWALRGPLFRLQIDLNPHGTKVQHIYNRDLASITLPMPQTLEEQELISDILFLAAERIEKESTSLAKVQRMKQGLMQDLLTGRVRVTHLGEIAA